MQNRNIDKYGKNSKQRETSFPKALMSETGQEVSAVSIGMSGDVVKGCPRETGTSRGVEARMSMVCLAVLIVGWAGNWFGRVGLVQMLQTEW